MLFTRMLSRTFYSLHFHTPSPPSPPSMPLPDSPNWYSKKERKKELHKVQLCVQLRKPSVCASTPDELACRNPHPTGTHDFYSFAAVAAAAADTSGRPATFRPDGAIVDSSGLPLTVGKGGSTERVAVGVDGKPLTWKGKPIILASNATTLLASGEHQQRKK